eukprot:1014148-Amphidinium_carterae.5
MPHNEQRFRQCINEESKPFCLYFNFAFSLQSTKLKVVEELLKPVAGSKRESIERKVQKSLRDALSDLTHEEIHCIVVDGMTLIQRLRQDKTIAESGECMDIRFGDKVTMVANVLEFCCFGTVDTKVVFLRSPQSCSTRTCWGEVKHPSGKSEIEKNQAVAVSYASTFATREGPFTWLEMHSNVWPLVLPSTAVMSILNCAESDELASMETNIKLVANPSSEACCSAGARWASSDMEGAAMTEIIETRLGELGKYAAITEKEVADVMAELSACLGKESPGFGCKKRKSSLIYGGWTIPLAEQSVAEEVEVKLVAKLREFAVACGSLPKLPVEASLCTHPASSVTSVTTDRIAKAKASRRFMERVLNQEEEQNMSGQLVMDQEWKEVNPITSQNTILTTNYSVHRERTVPCDQYCGEWHQ